MTSRSDQGRHPVTLTYTNWRGEMAERTITPTGRTLFTSNEWHPEPQWFVEALDARSGEVRLFALSGLGHAPAEPTEEMIRRGVWQSHHYPVVPPGYADRIKPIHEFVLRNVYMTMVDPTRVAAHEERERCV